MPDPPKFINTDRITSGRDTRFISCDWGTSSFRLRLVETSVEPGDPATPALRVLSELKDGQGIAATFELWKQTGKSENERLSFYRSVLEAKTADLQQTGLQRNYRAETHHVGPQQARLQPIDPQLTSLVGIPLVISGMASSSIGMKELPYKELPLDINGKDLYVEMFEATEDHPRRTLLLSGIRSANDVMRGEETQLIGCLPSQFNLNQLQRQDRSLDHLPGQDRLPAEGDRIFIFPGTHSKHIRVRDGKAVDFKTYMTGEYFALLSKHSILSVSVAESDPPMEHTPPPPGFLRSFEQGVRDSIDGNLLHHSFLVRTHQLFGVMSKEENYYYLSGLLIGTECRDLPGFGVPLTVVSGGALQASYSSALRILGFTGFEIQDPDEAVIRGQARIWQAIPA